MKNKLSEQQILKNKNIMRLLHQACFYNDFYSLSKMTKETEVLKSLTQKKLMYESSEMYEIGKLAEKLLAKIEDKQKQTEKNPFLAEISRIAKAGKPNSSLINWVIYELSKFCKVKAKNNKIGTDWEEIANILTSKSFKPLLFPFKIDEVVYGKSINATKSRLRSRARKWCEVCEELKINPDFFQLADE